jgi:hypothetical protein
VNRRLHGGDLQIASSILASGNNFSKIALFARFLKLNFPGAVKFSNIQRTYVVPTIDSFWKDQQKEIIQEIGGQSIVVLGLYK